MKSPIRYAGGKTRAIKHIEKYIPKNIDKLISPFFGGGSLEIYLAYSRNLKVIGYDVFDILVNYWNVQIHQPKSLYNILSTFSPTKEVYKDIKNKLKSWTKSQNLFSQLKTDYYQTKSINYTDVEGAAYYWFNHNLSYGPMYMGWPSSVYLNTDKYKKMIEKVRDFDGKNIEVYCEDFITSIPKHNNDFLYLDPPYLLNDDIDNEVFAGLYPNKNFDVHHSGFNHIQLRDMLHNHNGGFVLSYNNCSTIREWYKDYEIYFPKWKYSFANGEKRIGKNRENMMKNIKNSYIDEEYNIKAKDSKEILIVKK